MQGKITTWFPTRYFGFVAIDGGIDFFFHERDVVGELRRGDIVEFWLDDDPKRGNLVAVEVRRLARFE